SCRFCSSCLGGNYHLCDDRRIYSYIPLSDEPGLWGAYSEYMFVHGNSIVHKMDNSLPAEIAVMFNPLGAGYRWAVEVPGTGPGDTVVILGPGQRGLASVLACKDAGASKIIVTGLAADAEKLRIARAFGAHHTIDVENENAKQRIKELTGGKGADIVVDVTSYAVEPVAESLSYVRSGGTIVLAGMKGYKNIPGFVSDKIMMKEITIKGVIGVTSTGYEKAINLIESGIAPLAMMHTHNFDLREAERAIQVLAREIPNEESIHSCLIPGLT
ncbi:MAG: zinc-binding dehydrogenase, partial [Rhodospirillaceae bacterium]|nr:zinc-binding dehydrogenase [Rhodospirillaceae bacterium]